MKLTKKILKQLVTEVINESVADSYGVRIDKILKGIKFNAFKVNVTAYATKSVYVDIKLISNAMTKDERILIAGEIWSLDNGILKVVYNRKQINWLANVLNIKINS